MAAARSLGTSKPSDDLLFRHLVTLTVLTRDTWGPMQILKPSTNVLSQTINIYWNIPIISSLLCVSDRPRINRNKLLIQYPHSLLLHQVIKPLKLLAVFLNPPKKVSLKRQGKKAITLLAYTHNKPENVYLWHCWVVKIRESQQFVLWIQLLYTHQMDWRDTELWTSDCCLTPEHNSTTAARDRCNNGWSLIRSSFQFAYSFQIILISLSGQYNLFFWRKTGVIFILIVVGFVICHSNIIFIHCPLAYSHCAKSMLYLVFHQVIYFPKHKHQERMKNIYNKYDSQWNKWVSLADKVATAYNLCTCSQWHPPFYLPLLDQCL